MCVLNPYSDPYHLKLKEIKGNRSAIEVRVVN